MPHGDFSDIASLVLFGLGTQLTAYTELSFAEVGPFKPCFDGAATPAHSFTLKLLGSFVLILACALFTVRWNTVNGKLVGAACVATGGNLGYSVFHGLDGAAFVLRPFYPIALVLVLAGFHLMFNANPMLPRADGKKTK